MRLCLERALRIALVESDIESSAEFSTRVALPKDSRLLASWIQSAEEAYLLGAKTIPFSPHEAETWIENAVTAFILSYAPANLGQDHELVGFINLERLFKKDDVTQFEIGRLVIHPEWRSKRFGTHLLCAMVRAVTAVVRAPSPVIRTRPCNMRARALISRQSFFHSIEPLERGGEYLWFRYQDHAS